MLLKDKLPKSYIPKSLSKEDQKKQLKEIKKSRELYKKGEYYIREPIKSFIPKKSQHIINAQKLYNIDSIKPSQELAKKSGCSIEGMNEIIAKGKAAYYTSGSRPNQTPTSWALARLSSSLSGGPASKIDYHILKKHCKPHSIALKMAQKNI